jgi:hypothetical protein
MGLALRVKSPPLPSDKWQWFAGHLTNPDLSSDELRLLALLAWHLGERGCYPALPRLCALTGWSERKVRRVRDGLAARGLIAFESGTGHRSTRFELVDLGRRQRHPGVSKTGTQDGVQVTTKPNPSTESTEPDARARLTVIEGRPLPTGWATVVAGADDRTKLWLGNMQVLSESDGTVILRTDNPAAPDWLHRQLADDPAFRRLIESAGIDPERVTVEAPRHGSGKPVLPPREDDPAGHGHRRHRARCAMEQMDEAGWQIAERDRPPKVVSMFTAARRPNQTRAPDLKGEP